MKSIVPQGYENPLEMDTLAKGTFICSFQNITNYPFGEQYCAFSFFIKGVDNELTSLEPIFVNFYGKKSVGRVGKRILPKKVDFINISISVACFWFGVFFLFIEVCLRLLQLAICLPIKVARKSRYFTLFIF